MAFWVRQREIVPPKFSISLGTYNRPKRNWKESSCKFLGDNKEYYGIFEKALLRTYILSRSRSRFAWMLPCFCFVFFFAVFVFFIFIYPFIASLSIFWPIEMLRRKLILKRSVLTLKSTSPATPPCNQFFCPWYIRLSLCLQNCLFFLTL